MKRYAFGPFSRIRCLMFIQKPYFNYASAILYRSSTYNVASHCWWVASVGGIMVSIVAFQAIDPGSIPGQRIFCLISVIFIYFYNCYLRVLLHNQKIITSWSTTDCTIIIHSRFFLILLLTRFEMKLFLHGSEATLVPTWCSVGGIMVSIVAFQAIDPGSIPGQRIFIFFIFKISNLIIVVDCFVLALLLASLYLKCSELRWYCEPYGAWGMQWSLLTVLFFPLMPIKQVFELGDLALARANVWYYSLVSSTKQIINAPKLLINICELSLC